MREELKDALWGAFGLSLFVLLVVGVIGFGMLVLKSIAILLGAI